MGTSLASLRHACLAVALLTPLLPGAAIAQTLRGFASLPADTFAPGPTSGQFIAPANGVIPPFLDRQPVQGVSSVLLARNGDFLVMSDNGFGNKANSADYVLRVYRIDPEFKTRFRGDGSIDVESMMELRDPFHRINFPIVADRETYYPTSSIPVDPEIRSRRLLTGADFDIESFREAPDGTFWFGDEFGPFLIHTDHQGRVLEAPIPLPGVQSPDNPLLGGGMPNLLSSKGFEGMAIAPGGRTLYPMLEGALTTDPDRRRLIINEFDVPQRLYTGRQWFYKMDNPAFAIGDLTAVTRYHLLVIERDGGQGDGALFKKIFLVDLRRVDADGFLLKQEVADLLDIDDPFRLGGSSPIFRFPFTTIESVIPLGARTLGVLNDNNYPFSAGRTPMQPDPNEFIIIRLDEPLVDSGEDWEHGERWWGEDEGRRHRH